MKKIQNGQFDHLASKAHCGKVSSSIRWYRNLTTSQLSYSIFKCFGSCTPLPMWRLQLVASRRQDATMWTSHERVGRDATEVALHCHCNPSRKLRIIYHFPNMANMSRETRNSVKMTYYSFESLCSHFTRRGGLRPLKSRVAFHLPVTRQKCDRDWLSLGPPKAMRQADQLTFGNRRTMSPSGVRDHSNVEVRDLSFEYSRQVL